MAIFTNFTPYAVGEIVGLDPEGAEFYSVIVKATFTWSDDGKVEVAAEQQPLVEVDVYAGEPGLSGPLMESDYAPFKPRVDVVLAGAVTLPTPVEQVDTTLEVGNRIRKTVRVVGDRVWIPGVLRSLALTKPRPFSSMPLEWDRAFGGTDPDDPTCFEPRNPVGIGMRKKVKTLEGQRGPNFENPRQTIKSSDDRPAPAGFGPIGRAWQPRIKFAGTYDDAWQEDRFPLCPLDFDPAFHNCAPTDQQLDSYVPGEEVRLNYLTAAGHERFRLPDFGVELLITERSGKETRDRITPDTIVIEPAKRRLSLAGRLCHFPEPNALALQAVLVGKPSAGFARAFATGKQYLRPQTLKPWDQA